MVGVPRRRRDDVNRREHYEKAEAILADLDTLGNQMNALLEKFGGNVPEEIGESLQSMATIALATAQVHADLAGVSAAVAGEERTGNIPEFSGASDRRCRCGLDAPAPGAEPFCPVHPAPGTLAYAENMARRAGEID
jgi:hypothetical protein